jgi:hypothetical protein
MGQIYGMVGTKTHIIASEGSRAGATPQASSLIKFGI